MWWNKLTTNSNNKQNTGKAAPVTKAAKKRANAILRQAAIGNISGQGGYFSDVLAPFLKRAVPDGTFSKFGSGLGATLGGTFGPAGSAIGGIGGGWLGKKLSQIVGFGDYSVISNTIAKQGGAVPEGNQIPAFGNSNHETHVCHREYLGEVVVPANPTEFNNTSYRINPGNSALFPWLSKLATSYSQYRINGMVIEFRSMSSDITAGGALGTVIMATDYDAVNDPYTDKISMENSQYAVSTKPSRSMVHAIECDPSITTQKVYYVRDGRGNSLVDKDPRFYDMGLFQLATKGLPGSAGQTLGEMWVSYDITLLKPVLVGGQANQLGLGANYSLVGAGTFAPTSIFGTSPSESFSLGYNNMVKWKISAPNTLTFARGRYLVTVYVTNSPGGLTVTPFDGTASVVSTNTAGSAIMSCTWLFTATSATGDMVFASGTPTKSRVVVTLIDPVSNIPIGA